MDGCCYCCCCLSIYRMRGVCMCCITLHIWACDSVVFLWGVCIWIFFFFPCRCHSGCWVISLYRCFIKLFFQFALKWQNICCITCQATLLVHIQGSCFFCFGMGVSFLKKWLSIFLVSPSSFGAWNVYFMPPFLILCVLPNPLSYLCLCT